MGVLISDEAKPSKGTSLAVGSNNFQARLLATYVPICVLEVGYHVGICEHVSESLTQTPAPPEGSLLALN